MGSLHDHECDLRKPCLHGRVFSIYVVPVLIRSLFGVLAPRIVTNMRPSPRKRHHDPPNDGECGTPISWPGFQNPSYIS